MLLGFEPVLAGSFLTEMQEQADLMAEFGERAVGTKRDIGRSFHSHHLSYHDILKTCA